MERSDNHFRVFATVYSYNKIQITVIYVPGFEGEFGTVFQGPGFESRYRCMFFTLIAFYFGQQTKALSNVFYWSAISASMKLVSRLWTVLIPAVGNTKANYVCCLKMDGTICLIGP